MMMVVDDASSMAKGTRRTKRLKRGEPGPSYQFSCPPSPPWNCGSRDAGALTTMTGPYSRPRSLVSQILKRAPRCHRIAPTALSRNGGHTLVHLEEKLCDAACWRLSLVLSRPAG